MRTCWRETSTITRSRARPARRRPGRATRAPWSPGRSIRTTGWRRHRGRPQARAGGGGKAGTRSEHQRPGHAQPGVAGGPVAAEVRLRALSDPARSLPGRARRRTFGSAGGNSSSPTAIRATRPSLRPPCCSTPALLDQVPVKNINRAVLTYDEVEVSGVLRDRGIRGQADPLLEKWHGFAQQKPAGCVGALRMPTVTGSTSRRRA
jgi:hypothetical protein